MNDLIIQTEEASVTIKASEGTHEMYLHEDLNIQGWGDRTTIYVVTELNDRRDDGDLYGEIESDHGYFTTRDEAQQYVDSLNAPILKKQAHRREVYEAQVQAWTKKSNKANKLGFRNPDYYPTDPGPLRPTFAVEEINPHEVTS